MESIVFANSPLADYLEGNGENDITIGSHTPFIEPTDNEHSFAPPSANTFRSRFSTRNLKPLRSKDPRTNYISQISDFLSRSVGSRLSSGENASFLERFRYSIIASQLLNGHINVSHYDRRTSVPMRGVHEEEEGQISKATIQHWITSGGCMLVASVALSWMFRGNGQKSGGSIFISLMVSGVVAGFWFLQEKRRWLRDLRGEAIDTATHFVENSQAFDLLAADAVTIIQEVELVARGYRLSTPLPPITRIEREGQGRRCTRMRRMVLSSLKIAIPAHMRALESLQEITEEADLEKYYDIYDIQTLELEESLAGVVVEEADDMESLKVLKTLLHRLHTIRRVFLCCLLALDAKGGTKDFSNWKVAVDHLRIVGNQMGDMSNELRRVMEEEEEFTVPTTPKSPTPSSPANERLKGQLRKLSSLSQALRGLQAKMHVLREDSDRNMRDSVDMAEFADELLAHYDSIGSDIHALVDEWENSRSAIAACVEQRDTKRNSLKSSLSLGGTTLAGDTPRNSLYGKEWDNESPDFGSPSMVPLPDSDEEKEVYEGEALPQIRLRSTLTREERIRKVQEERLRIADEREKAMASGLMIQELKNVLDTRSPTSARRRVVSMGAW